MSETFNYTYSAKQNDEVKKIREKYISKSNEESNYEKIKRLDANSTRGGTIASLVIGIISSLIMGTGMCCVMIWESMLLGILVGLIGLVGMIVAYPVYKRVVAADKEKVKDEILKLCEEELKEVN